MRVFALFLAVASLVWLTGCEGDNNPSSPAPMPEAGSISGTVVLPPSVPGTVEGTAVHIYTSREDAMLMRPTVTVIANKQGDFEFPSVFPGSYYLGLSKDNDNDGLLNSGDFVIDRTTHENCCCTVNASCATHVCPCVYVIP
jgi:hypothetical protein